VSPEFEEYFSNLVVLPLKRSWFLFRKMERYSKSLNWNQSLLK